MAEFYAYRILCGKTTFAKIPAKLKPSVKTILTEMGYAELCEE